MTARDFGATPDGDRILALEIAGGGLSASVITWGAVLRDLRLAGHAAPLVCGFDDLDSYLRHSPYFGAIAGRVANRIGAGRFTLDGTIRQVDRNENGNHLHGGAAGFGRRPWTVVDHRADAVTLEIVSPDGDMGYPGGLTARCTYRLADPGILQIRLEAATDAPTVVNLAHHSYFTLEDGADILDHRLWIDAERVTETDAALIPTGRLLPVAGTPWDFRRARPIRHEAADGRFRYDVNYCLSDAPTPAPRRVARVEGGTLAMELWTTEPGVQFYDGWKVGVPVPGLDGRRYGACAGLCLEAQRWPDAPNHPGFPPMTLRPGERYEQVTEYRFAASP